MMDKFEAICKITKLDVDSLAIHLIDDDTEYIYVFQRVLKNGPYIEYQHTLFEKKEQGFVIVDGVNYDSIEKARNRLFVIIRMILEFDMKVLAVEKLSEMPFQLMKE